MTKNESQRKHAKKRFLERYNFNFNRHIRHEFLRLIQTHQTILVETQSHRTLILDIYYNDNIFRVAYDRQRKEIVTVLPPETADRR